MHALLACTSMKGIELIEPGWRQSLPTCMPSCRYCRALHAAHNMHAEHACLHESSTMNIESIEPGLECSPDTMASLGVFQHRCMHVANAHWQNYNPLIDILLRKMSYVAACRACSHSGIQSGHELPLVYPAPVGARTWADVLGGSFVARLSIEDCKLSTDMFRAHMALFF